MINIQLVSKSIVEVLESMPMHRSSLDALASLVADHLHFQPGARMWELKHDIDETCAHLCAIEVVSLRLEYGVHCVELRQEYRAKYTKVHGASQSTERPTHTDNSNMPASVQGDVNSSALTESSIKTAIIEVLASRAGRSCPCKEIAANVAHYLHAHSLKDGDQHFEIRVLEAINELCKAQLVGCVIESASPGGELCYTLSANISPQPGTFVSHRNEQTVNRSSSDDTPNVAVNGHFQAVMSGIVELLGQLPNNRCPLMSFPNLIRDRLMRQLPEELADRLDGIVFNAASLLKEKGILSICVDNETGQPVVYYELTDQGREASAIVNESADFRTATADTGQPTEAHAVQGKESEETIDRDEPEIRSPTLADIESAIPDLPDVNYVDDAQPDSPYAVSDQGRSPDAETATLLRVLAGEPQSDEMPQEGILLQRADRRDLPDPEYFVLHLERHLRQYQNFSINRAIDEIRVDISTENRPLPARLTYDAEHGLLRVRVLLPFQHEALLDLLRLFPQEDFTASLGLVTRSGKEEFLLYRTVDVTRRSLDDVAAIVRRVLTEAMKLNDILRSHG